MSDEVKFLEYFRINYEQFNFVLSLVEENINYYYYSMIKINILVKNNKLLEKYI